MNEALREIREKIEETKRLMVKLMAITEEFRRPNDHTIPFEHRNGKGSAQVELFPEESGDEPQ